MAKEVIGRLRVSLGIDTAQFEKGLNSAQKSLSRVGKKMTSVGKSLSLSVSAPLAAFGALTLKTAADFETAMNRVGAVSGAVGNDLDNLSALARKMGRETQFSASQAADAMGFLAQAGFGVQEIMDALPGTLQLAASAQMDLGEAADIVSNVLSGYGLEIEQLSRVNDVLVKTFTSSNTNLQQLGEAMTYAAPIAAAAGVEFEQTAAALGLLGSAGIQASMAGTTLRGAIAKILDITPQASKRMKELGLNFQDAAGKILPLDQIVQQLAPHADDAGLFMELFGLRAGPGMAVLVRQGADELRSLTNELRNAGGTAEAIANAQMEGLNGALKRLASAFEGLQLAIANAGILDFITGLTEKLAGFVQRLAETDPALLSFITKIAALVAAIGPVILALGALAAALTFLLTPIGLVVAAIAALVAAGTTIYILRDTFKAALPEIGNMFMDLLLAPIRLAVKGILTALSTLINKANVIAEKLNLTTLSNKLGGLSDSLEDWADFEVVRFDAVAAKFEGATATMTDAVKSNIDELINSVVNASKTSVSITTPNIKINDPLGGIGDLKLEANEYDTVLDTNETVTSQMRDQWDSVGKSIGDSIGRGVVRGENLFSTLKNTVSQTINSMVQSVISSGISRLFGGIFGGIFGASTGGLGSIFGGFFANGGVPPMNKVSIVGERGPELFVPPGSGGRIVPNSAMGGSNVTVNIDARGAQDGLVDRLRVTLLQDVVPIISGTVDGRLNSMARPTA